MKRWKLKKMNQHLKMNAYVFRKTSFSGMYLRAAFFWWTERGLIFLFLFVFFPVFTGQTWSFVFFVFSGRTVSFVFFTRLVRPRPKYITVIIVVMISQTAGMHKSMTAFLNIAKVLFDAIMGQRVTADCTSGCTLMCAPCICTCQHSVFKLSSAHFMFNMLKHVVFRTETSSAFFLRA